MYWYREGNKALVGFCVTVWFAAAGSVDLPCKAELLL